MAELLKELKLGSVDWKGLLLAGICPSLIFSFGLIFCLQGPDGVKCTLESAFSSFQAFAVKSTPLLTANLVAAFLLYALRPITLHCYRRVPVPVVRKLMLWWSSLKRKRADKKLRIALWRIDVALWLQSDPLTPDRVAFERDQFAVQAVLDAQRPPDVAKTLARSARMRGWIVADSAMKWRFHRLFAFPIFEKLHLLAVRRTLVKDTAAKRAEQGGGTDLENWAAAEHFLAIQAPGDQLTAELAEWRSLYCDSGSVQNRVRDFDSRAIHDRHRECARKWGDYPSDKWIEPTKLGNILAALEDYAAERYGMDTAQLWSRLEAIVPKQQREQIASYQLALSSLLNANLALCLLALSAVVIGVLAHDWREWAFAACSLVAAYLCQSAAVYSASGLREKIEAAVDLNILRWLRSLGLVPADAGARLQIIRQLGTFYSGGTQLPGDFKFVPVAEAASEAKKKD